MKPLSLPRLIAISSLSFSLTLTTNVLEPSVFGHKVLQLAPDNPNTILGFATAIGSLVAISLPPFIGALYDRLYAPRGRRVPFFLAGAAITHSTSSLSRLPWSFLSWVYCSYGQLRPSFSYPGRPSILI